MSEWAQAWRLARIAEIIDENLPAAESALQTAVRVARTPGEERLAWNALQRIQREMGISYEVPA